MGIVARFQMIISQDQRQEQPQQCRPLWLFAVFSTSAPSGAFFCGMKLDWEKEISSHAGIVDFIRKKRKIKRKFDKNDEKMQLTGLAAIALCGVLRYNESIKRYEMTDPYGNTLAEGR